ncbi:uncharacterized protein LOC131072736 [Cryptomeria japonica]|uniref:uncharacterized protein LOC131072736 n=1 Tax=Cryptomeria japonica TaxID=3369 RepID=UPI0027D9D960|nr:uncharacterized protein LOC131072736 [Cryptomeria japonica]
MEDDSKIDQYSPNSTPLTWPSDLYVHELMDLKRRIEGLEVLEQLKFNKWQEVMETNHKITIENKSLKEEIANLQANLKTGQQKILTMKEELRQIKSGNFSTTTEERDTPHLQETQSVIENIEIKEVELKEQLEEAKSWVQVTKGSTESQKELIEKQIKVQIEEERQRKDRAANIIIKGLKDYGEGEHTDRLIKDFLADKLE